MELDLQCGSMILAKISVGYLRGRMGLPPAPLPAPSWHATLLERIPFRRYRRYKNLIVPFLTIKHITAYTFRRVGMGKLSEELIDMCERE